MAKKAVIIPAAGSGVRLGSEIPKPFIELSGVPILKRTLMPFLKVEGMVQIIISTSKAMMTQCEKLWEEINADGIECKIVEGGKERQNSIMNALNQLNDEVELVAVHDAVRPFVTVGQITKCFDMAQEFDGAVLGVPAKDTIKRINSETFIEQTPNRDFLWQAQTPQVFKKNLLIEAYNSAIQNGFLGTDDASLVEQIGGRIKMVEGSRENLKITYPIDLEVANLIVGKS